MLRRSGLDQVRCRFGGEHSTSSARLRVVAARASQLVWHLHLVRDEEAQHWLGWRPDPARLAAIEALRSDPLMIRPEQMVFLAVQPATGRVVASIDIDQRPDGVYTIGGMVDPELRGQGYGREALETVCRLAHRHFGIRELIAGCEMTNLASRAWLASCQFVVTEGPATHTLPNGRVIASLWWARTDDAAQRRCRNPGR